MKHRSDSLFARLKPEQREELLVQALEAGQGYEALKKLCSDKFGISVSLAALSRFLSRESLSWRLERAKAAAERTLGQLPADWEKRQKEALAQQLFQATLGNLEVKEAYLLKSLELEEAKVRLKDREVGLKVQTLELRVKEFEAKTAAVRAKLEKVVSKGGVDPKTLKTIESALNLL